MSNFGGRNILVMFNVMYIHFIYCISLSSLYRIKNSCFYINVTSSESASVMIKFLCFPQISGRPDSGCPSGPSNGSFSCSAMSPGRRSWSQSEKDGASCKHGGLEQRELGATGKCDYSWLLVTHDSIIFFDGASYGLRTDSSTLYLLLLCFIEKASASISKGGTTKAPSTK